MGASRSLEKVLKDYNVDILAIQEIRWGTIEIMDLKEYTIINSGHKENRLGTGFMIKKVLKHTLLAYKNINERLCTIRLKGKFFNISIFSAHAPTEDKTDEEKDKFYDELSREYDNLPSYDVKMVLGDLNAKIGKEPAFRPTIGSHSKHDVTNDNGLRVIDFATEKGMIISSTKFPHKEVHKETWTSPDGHTKNQIDHVLTEARHASDVMDVRSYRGADAESDHYLVIVPYRQKLAKSSRDTMERMALFNTDRLVDPEVIGEFQERIKNKLNNSDEEVEDGVPYRWSRIKGAITAAAEDVLGRRERGEIKNNWYDEECEAALRERNEARKKVLQRNTRANKENYKNKRKAAKTICRQKKRTWERKKLEKLEEEFSSKQSRKFYKGIKEIKKGFQANSNMCKSEEGMLIYQIRKKYWKS